MGLGMSEEEPRDAAQEDLQRIARKFQKCPDVTVNRAVVMFCGSSSSEILQRHLDDRKRTGRPSSDWTRTLTEKLAGLSPAPGLAGVGALAVAVLIDALSPPEESTKEALRAAFTEEKASEVWDQIDECLKRCTMNLDHNDELVTDMRRMEVQLSAAVTRLKNSMVRDDHVSSEALKAWVNGAAFHVQLLVHLVRLGGIQSCQPVERLVGVYLRDLDSVFNKHRAAVRKRCRLGYDNLADAPCSARPYFETEEGEAYYVSRFIGFEEYFQAYYEEHYSSQREEIRSYLSGVRDHLPALVSQEGRLSVQ